MVAAHYCRYKEQEVPQERTHQNGRERCREAQPRNEERPREHHQKPRAQASPQDEEVQKPEPTLPLRYGLYAPIRRLSQHALLLSLRRWQRLDNEQGRGVPATSLILLHFPTPVLAGSGSKGWRKPVPPLSAERTPSPMSLSGDDSFASH